MKSFPPSNGPLGVLGPIELVEFREYLDAGALDDAYPLGMGGTPVTLLCKELLQRGCDLAVFTVDPSIDTERVFKGRRLRIYFGPYSARDATNLFRRQREFLLQAIDREKPAFLHAHFTSEYALAAIESGLPHVVTAHDATVNCLRYAFIPSLQTRRTFRNYYKGTRGIVFSVMRAVMAYRVARKAQSVVAVSPYVADHLRRYGLRRGRIDVIPNGIPAVHFERPRNREPDGAFTFATVLPQWNSLKNGRAAVEAFARVRKVLPDLQMLMLGTGHSADGPAAAWATQRGLERGIEFIGQVPYAKVIDLLSRRVDVLVHPSLEEAHPMPLIEAMSLAIPVIAGDRVGGVPWTLGNGECGVLVDVRSPDQIASAMIRLAQDANTRTRLGAAGREFARRRFNIEQVADQYEAIYAEGGAQVWSRCQCANRALASTR
jgi:glycosyltransferase involved in cell wall biosynthesis